MNNMSKAEYFKKDCAEDFVKLDRKLQEQVANNNNDKSLNRRAELVATIIEFNDAKLPKSTVENTITLLSPNMKYEITIKEDADKTVITIKEQ